MPMPPVTVISTSVRVSMAGLNNARKPDRVFEIVPAVYLIESASPRPVVPMVMAEIATIRPWRLGRHRATSAKDLRRFNMAVLVGYGTFSIERPHFDRRRSCVASESMIMLSTINKCVF
jgi:hypothetical protein